MVLYFGAESFCLTSKSGLLKVLVYVSGVYISGVGKATEAGWMVEEDYKTLCDIEEEIKNTRGSIREWL